MRLETDVFDLWVFSRTDGEPRYLLLHVSQEKADRWFGGSSFWQIPTDRQAEGESLLGAIDRLLTTLECTPTAIWQIEHVYPIYNRRFEALQLIPAFAAELSGTQPVPLTWEHDRAVWATAAEAGGKLVFRGLRDGLDQLRTYVSETDGTPGELRLR